MLNRATFRPLTFDTRKKKSSFKILLSGNVTVSNEYRTGNLINCSGSVAWIATVISGHFVHRMKEYRAGGSRSSMRNSAERFRRIIRSNSRLTELAQQSWTEMPTFAICSDMYFLIP
jgi:hypothetical protein